MIALKWEDKFSVGFEEIDHQHKQWFYLLDEIREAIQAGQSMNIVEEYIQKLDDYSVFHFSQEEKFMAEINFPYLEEHIRQHQEFIKKIDNFKIELDPEKRLSAFNILEFLINWIAFHVLESDKEYAVYYRKLKKSG